MVFDEFRRSGVMTSCSFCHEMGEVGSKCPNCGAIIGKSRMEQPER
jgi:cytochrome c553